jgi:hypothetical protein
MVRIAVWRGGSGDQTVWAEGIPPSLGEAAGKSPHILGCGGAEKFI